MTVEDKIVTHDPLEALKLAIDHIEHMTSWIALRNKDSMEMSAYSFESLGEDMPGLREALTASAPKGEPCAWRYRFITSVQRDWSDWFFVDDKKSIPTRPLPDIEIEPIYTSPPPAAGWDEDCPYYDERFEKGVQHVVDLIARELAVDDYVAGDGSEDYDCDLWQTILNILAAKGLYDKDECEFVALRREAPGSSGVKCANCNDPLVASDAPLFCGCCREMGASRPDAGGGVREVALKNAIRDIRSIHEAAGERGLLNQTAKLQTLCRNAIEQIDAALSTPSDAVNESAEARLREALTPSGATKAAYIGEFHFSVDDRDEEGEECTRMVTVPWTTTKEIMKAVLDRALSAGGDEAKKSEGGTEGRAVLQHARLADTSLSVSGSSEIEAGIESGPSDPPDRREPAPADDAAVAWQTVPTEPTWEMQIAGRDAILADDDELDLSTDDAAACYRAMLAKAPTLRPAKAVDVEAIARIIDPHSFCDIPFTDDPTLLDMVEQSKVLALTKGKAIAALLRDSNASSDKGGR